MYQVSLLQQIGTLLIFHYSREHCYINNNNTASQGQVNVFWSFGLKGKMGLGGGNLFQSEIKQIKPLPKRKVDNHLIYEHVREVLLHRRLSIREKGPKAQISLFCQHYAVHSNIFILPPLQTPTTPRGIASIYYPVSRLQHSPLKGNVSNRSYS